MVNGGSGHQTRRAAFRRGAPGLVPVPCLCRASDREPATGRAVVEPLASRAGTPLRGRRTRVRPTPMVWSPEVSMSLSLSLSWPRNEGKAPMPEITEPDERTLQAERNDARRLPGADRSPTPQEESDAERQRRRADPAGRKSAAEHYAAMAELGARAKGEVEIT